MTPLPRVVLQCAPVTSRSTLSCAASIPRELIRDSRQDYWNDGIGLTSAAILLASVVVGARALREQVASPSRERRHALYHSLVVGPSIDEIRRFESTARTSLQAGADRVAKIRSNDDARAADLSAATEALAREFQRCLEPVAATLLLVASAWKNEPLRERIDSALDALEDDVVKGIGLLQMREPVTPPLADRLQRGTANVLAEITHFDIHESASRKRRFLRRRD